MTITVSAPPTTVVRRLFDEVINVHRPELTDTVMARDVTVTRTGLQQAGPFLAARAGIGQRISADGRPGHGGSHIEQFQAGLGAIVGAFPDFYNEIVSLTADGDTVVARLKFTGTFTNPFLGVAPTGQGVCFDEVVFFRVADGLIVEVWAFGDELAFLTQLGVFPGALADQ